MDKQRRRTGHTEHYEAFGNNNRTSRQSNGYDIEMENKWARKYPFYIIILWDHRRICGPSLTETSLCGAYLYTCLLVAERTRFINPTFDFETKHVCLHFTMCNGT
jgi:hypothetical protein